MKSLFQGLQAILRRFFSFLKDFFTYHQKHVENRPKLFFVKWFCKYIYVSSNGFTINGNPNNISRSFWNVLGDIEIFLENWFQSHKKHFSLLKPYLLSVVFTKTNNVLWFCWFYDKLGLFSKNCKIKNTSYYTGQHSSL